MRQLLLLMSVTAVLSCELQPLKNLTNPNSRSSIIEVSWNELSVSDLNCVRGYRICLQEGSSFERCKHVLDASISNYTFTDLKTCTNYSISVAVLGENNTISEPVSLTTNTAPPPLSTGVDFYRKNHSTIVAYWSYALYVGRTCAREFELSLCDVSENNCNTSIIPVSGTDHEQDLLWKQDCNAFVVKMSVLDINRQRSDTTLYTGAPGFIDAPQNLKVTKVTSSSFDLEWALPASQIGCEFFAKVYTNRIRGSITDSNPVSILDGSTTTHTETDLSPCSRYEATVTFGTTETAKSVKTTVYTLPEGNTVFKSASAPASVYTYQQVAWTTSLTNSYCIAACTVCWKVKGTIDENCRNATSTYNTSLTITGLAASTLYQFSIAAVLQNGVEYDKVLLNY